MEDIGLTIHPHPTLSETLCFAAEMAEGTITDLLAPKKKHYRVIPAQAGIQRFYSTCSSCFASALRRIFLTGFRPAPE